MKRKPLILLASFMMLFLVGGLATGESAMQQDDVICSGCDDPRDYPEPDCDVIIVPLPWGGAITIVDCG